MALLKLPKLIVINRSIFRLTLWRGTVTGGYKLELNRPIAIGQVGHETPTGVYFVEWKTRTPDWLAPNSDWVPEDMRGKIYPFDDPHNPFAGGFISFAHSDGVGIHGTKFDPALGTMASHGCIRMSVPDLESLYTKVATGTPVFIY